MRHLLRRTVFGVWLDSPGNGTFLSGSRQRRGLPNNQNSALLTLVNHEANPVLRRIPYLRRIVKDRKPNFFPHRTFGFARRLKE